MKLFTLTLCVVTFFLCAAVTQGVKVSKKSKSRAKEHLPDANKQTAKLDDFKTHPDNSSPGRKRNLFDISKKSKLMSKRKRSRRKARKKTKKNLKIHETTTTLPKDFDVSLVTSGVTTTLVPSTNPDTLVNWLPGVGNRPCGECIWQDCQPVDAMKRHCPSGVIRDQCSCCVECASGVGMPCYLNSFAPMWLPPCGDDLICVPFEGERGIDIDTNEWGGHHGMEGYCSCTSKGPVCGNNNITYDNICEFREVAARSHFSNSLELARHGPCTTDPRLNSRLTDIVATVGDIVSFRCEATGFPLPRMQWFKKRSENIDEDFLYDLLGYEDSVTEIELPGHLMNAVTQVRGGPAKYQITTWLTLDKVKTSDKGIYSCRATNGVGAATDSASLEINEP